MARFHFGRLDHPGTVTFVHDGYWYKGVDDADFHFVRYREPTPTSRPIQRMYGFSAFGIFVGVMKLGQSK